MTLLFRAPYVNIPFLGALLALALWPLSQASAQFIGPCGTPAQPSCALLIASSTRALGISTSTIYSTQGTLTFRTYGGSNQHVLFLPNGKVGIATTTPTSTLTVQGDIFASGNIYGVSFVGGVSGAVNAANVSSGVFGSLQGNGNFAFPVSLGVATSTKDGLPQALSVYGKGYFADSVGIGSSNPSTLLHLANATRAVLKFERPGTAAYRLGLDGNDLKFADSDDLQTNVHLIIQRATGNIGVGTTTIGYKLTVGGTGYFGSQLTVGGGGINVTSGNLVMNGGNISGVNKLTVTTVDPLYSIGGTKYATYGPSVVGGVYEEYVETGALVRVAESGIFEYVIDFTKEPKGSDRWLWHRIVDFGPDTVSVFLTPRGSWANLYYLIEGDRLTVRGDRASEFSLRIIGKRFDWRTHPTKALDQGETPSFTLPE